MAPRYRYQLDKFPFYDIKADTAADGTRVYHTPMGDAPSVTTILSTLPHPELDAWKIRVGPEEAERVSKEATTIGSHMHDMLEAKLRDIPYVSTGTELEAMAARMVKPVQLLGWSRLNEVWGIEASVHYGTLYAGRTDLVGVYARKPSIIDYKTSKVVKLPDEIPNYKTQMAMYAMAVQKQFDYPIDQGVLLFSIRPNDEYRKLADCRVVIISGDEFMQCKLNAIEVLIDYWSVRDESKLDQINQMLHMVGA